MISIAGVAITKYDRIGGLNNKKLFLIVVMSGSSRSGCWQGWLPLRLLSLPYRCLSSCCALTWPFVCVLTPLVFLPLLKRTPVLLD